jgi:membrane-associated phospholipid phosphatase
VLRRFDKGLLRLMRTRGHGPATERAMRVLGAAGEWGAVWAGGALCAAAFDRRRRGRWLAVSAIGPLAVGANFGVKVAFRRRRPVLDGLPALAGAPSELSFPSAHATSSLAAATAMARVAPGARAPLYAFAALICLTRPYLGMHYPSDVLAGAALGAALGRAWPVPAREGAVAAAPAPSTS